MPVEICFELCKEGKGSCRGWGVVVCLCPFVFAIKEVYTVLGDIINVEYCYSLGAPLLFCGCGDGYEHSGNAPLSLRHLYTV